MSEDFTPTEAQIIEQYTRTEPPRLGTTVTQREREAKRGLNRIKAQVWAECSQWHAEEGMPVHGAATEHNPYLADASDAERQAHIEQLERLGLA